MMEDKMADKLSYLLDYNDSIHVTGSGSTHSSTGSHFKLSHSNNSTDKQQQQLKYEMRKYETLVKADFDTLQNKYADLWASYTSSQAEIVKLNKSVEALLSERNSMMKEKDGLKQQCSAAILQWDKAMRENNEAKEQLAKVQQQRDDALKKINQEMALRIKAAKDLSRLTEERNAAYQEYHLVMSERESVHKEIERLTEELADSQKKSKQSENEKQCLINELNAIKKEYMYTDSKEREMRDRLLDHGLINLKANASNGACSSNRWMSSSSGIASSWMMHNYGKTASVNSKDNGSSMSAQLFRNKPLSGSNSSSVSSCGPQIKHTLFTKGVDTAHLSEAEGDEAMWRKQIDALQHDIMEMAQEADSCKQQRDEAVSEKEKAVQERESIRLLSDKLRRERDRAIRDLAEALRDLDDCKRQKSDTMLDLCDYKHRCADKNGSDNENKANLDKKIMPTNSLDNHLGASTSDSEYENVDVKLMNKFTGFGHPPYWGLDIIYRNKQVLVRCVEKDSPAVNLLQPMDVILKINSIPVDNDEFCRRLLSECYGEVRISLLRRKNVMMTWLDFRDIISYGLQLDKVTVIRNLRPNSPAGIHNRLQVGDILLQVNGVEVTDSFDLDQVLSQSSNQVSIQFYRGLMADYFKLDRLEPNELQCSNSRTDANNKDTRTPPFAETCIVSSGKKTNKKAKENNFEELHQHFGEVEKPASNILDRAYHRLFGKSNKSKGDKNKEDKVLRNQSFDEKETLEAFNQVLDDFTSKKESGKKSSKNSVKGKKDKTDNGGTWPKYRPSNGTSFPTFSKVNGTSTMYPVKRKERKSLFTFTSLTRPSVKERPIEMASSVPKHHVNFSYKHDLHNPYSLYSDQHARLTSFEMCRTANYKMFPEIYAKYSQFPYQPQVKGKGFKKDNHDYSISSSLSSHTSSVLKEQSLNKYKFEPSTLTDMYQYDRNAKKPSYVRPNTANLSLYGSVHESASPTSPTANQTGSFERFAQNENLMKNKLARMCSDRSPILLQSPVTFGYYSNSESSKKTDKILEPSSIGDRFSRPNSCIQSTNHPPMANCSVGSFNQSLTYSSQSPKLKTFAPLAMNSHNLDSQHDFSSEQRYPITPSPSSSMYSGELLGTSPAHHHADSHIHMGRSIHINHIHSPSFQNQLSKPLYSNDNGLITARHHMQRSTPTTEMNSLYGHCDSLGTFPKRNQRIRISSNNSVNSKVSNCSIDKHLTDTEQPFSSLPVTSGNNESAHIMYRVEWLNRLTVKGRPTTGECKPENKCDSKSNIPQPGDIRSIQIEKANEPLGIQISNLPFEKHIPCPGIFISTVSPNSLAARVGLQVGDQLLEICGINMRSANYDAAANVLRQCGNMLNVKVQFNPDKYEALKQVNGSASVSYPDHSMIKRRCDNIKMDQDTMPRCISVTNRSLPPNDQQSPQVFGPSSSITTLKINSVNSSRTASPLTCASQSSTLKENQSIHGQSMPNHQFHSRARTSQVSGDKDQSHINNYLYF